MLVREVKYARKMLISIFHPNVDIKFPLHMSETRIKAFRVHCDNTAAITLGKSDINNGRTKYMDIRSNFIADNIRDKLIDVLYVSTHENVADMFTKPSAWNRLKNLTFE